jgi:hypothetical protein
MNVEKYNRFAGDIKCKNIDPEIRKYIGFEDNEFESFPQPVQDKFLSEAIEDYIKELKNNSNRERYVNNSNYNSAFDHESLGNTSFYYDTTEAVDEYIHINISDTGCLFFYLFS